MKAAGILLQCVCSALALVAGATPLLSQDDEDVGRSRQALSGGVDSPDNPQANAALDVNGASGTLVAPDIALTNGHVVGVSIPVTPPFSTTNAPYPDQWYPIPAANTIQIVIGTQRFGKFAVDTLGRGLNSRTLLELDDRNGGAVESGDEIGLKTANNRYLYVDGGRDGGRVLVDTLVDRYAGWQKFTLERIDGPGRVQGFDKVALKAADGSYVASLGPRRASYAQADGTTRRPEHVFTVWRSGGRGELRHGDTFGLFAAESEGAWIQYPYVLLASQIAFPGYDDLVLLKLDTVIPNDVAVPRRVQVALPPGTETPGDFYAGKTFTVHGFGQAAGGVPSNGRQQGSFDNATLSGAPSVYNARGVSGAGIMCGDSGSGWVWDGKLVGVTQRGGCGAGTFTGGVFIASVSYGGVDSGGLSKPDLTAWYGLHLDLDDCGAVTAADRAKSPAFDRTGATEVCRFGGDDEYAVALFGGGRDGDDCHAIDPDALALGRPSGSATTWLLREGAVRHLLVPGSWQQSYTRGAYLIDFAKRRNLRKLCFDGRPNPRLTYFRP